ncbi:hypothetical protein N0V90_004621 [Kalmusia sp. IMI 367209]|nr:hypothetical protein N0V90_004621 [Kalmusia sp. IMI 367209]
MRSLLIFAALISATLAVVLRSVGNTSEYPYNNDTRDITVTERDGAVVFQIQKYGDFKFKYGKHWWFLTMKELRAKPLYELALCYNMKSTDISTLEFYPDDDDLVCAVWDQKNCPEKGAHKTSFYYKDDKDCYHYLRNCYLKGTDFNWDKKIASMRCWQRRFAAGLTNASRAEVRYDS